MEILRVSVIIIIFVVFTFVALRELDKNSKKEL